MSVVDPILQEMAGTGAGSDVFALTDEQIVGMGEDTGGPGAPGRAEIEEGSLTAATKGAASVRDDGVGNEANGKLGAGDGKGAQAGVPVPQEVPPWLAESMKDPWHGDEATELWDAKQSAEKEVAAYREVFATAKDARALKEIYPGGVSEAKTAADRARTLDEIDAAFYRGDGAARAQLAQRMMREDPAAFREMVEAGVRLLTAENRKWKMENGNSEEGVSQDAVSVPRSLRSGPQEARPSGRDDKTASADGGNAGIKASATEEAVRQYGAFERAANLELEKSMGGTIARMMEQALPNLRTSSSRMDAGGGGGGADPASAGKPPLQDRLAGAVREEVEAALKSDSQLGEQVAKILAGRRFDEGARAQVVRLIDARAQQLVPGAVRRVVGSWTQATLGVRGSGREQAQVKREELSETERRIDAPQIRKDRERAIPVRNEKVSASRRELGAVRGRGVDYGRVSDE